MITQSAFDFTTQTEAVGMYMCAGRGEGARVWTGVVPQTCGSENGTCMYRWARADTNTVAHREQTHACKHTDTDLPLNPLPLFGLSPLALSCFPDSRWRPDRRAEWLEVRLCDVRPGPLSVTSTLQACCLKINWQIETQNCCRSCLTPCLSTYFFFSPLLTPRWPSAGALRV